MTRYAIRPYDTCWNDVRGFAEYESEADAMQAARDLCESFYASDCIEVQVLISTPTLGSWQMIGAYYYDDSGEVDFEECFC